MPHAQRVALAVDDEPSDLEAVRKILENAGYAVLTAADGKTALDKFQPNAESVGLLVTDVAMSPMDGCELASRLVQLKPSLRVVFCFRVQWGGGHSLPRSATVRFCFRLEAVFRRGTDVQN